MAQLVPPARVSQLLPTVKCSNCSQPVPLDQLSDHTCPPVPSLPKPLLSPQAATSLLPLRLQSKVSSPLATPPRSPTQDVPQRRPNDRLHITTSPHRNPAPPGPSPLSRSSINNNTQPRPPPTNDYSRLSSASTIRPSPPEIDTKSGGEAGMAGVGRRGFAAAARAAMFVSPSMDGRRANAPRYLDTTTTRSATTPPLSPASGYSSHSHSPGPLSPSPQSPYPPGPLHGTAPLNLHRASSRSPSPPDPAPKSHAPVTNTADQQRPASPAASLSSYGASPPARTLSLKSEPLLLSPTAGSEIGLAYADSSDYDDDDDDDGAELKKIAAGDLVTRPPPPAAVAPAHIRSPSVDAKPDRNSSTTDDRSSKTNSALVAHALGLTQPGAYGKFGAPVTRRGSARGSTSSASSGSSSSSAYSAAPPPSGALERAMETLLEDVATSASSSGSVSGRSSSPFELAGAAGTTKRSNTVQGPHAPSPKLPVRALTGPTRDRDSARRPRVCVRCEDAIEDRRWVQMDGGSVLCERCWKNMYLPKCRRCNLPIEKQAVSSSDGQLKGKYHRDCFNCHRCHKPFPDKSFYVYDGKPMCAYHYHEANASLCAAARCGQPIEGPCAVSHAGDRYHPEHMLCEHPGHPPCTQRLVEYWEVDGRMLCEQHRMGFDDDDEGGDGEAEGGEEAGKDAGKEWAQSARAQKRVTRFIDLGGERL